MSKGAKLIPADSKKQDEFPRLNESRSTLTRKLSLVDNAEKKS